MKVNWWSFTGVGLTILLAVFLMPVEWPVWAGGVVGGVINLAWGLWWPWLETRRS